jgi:hypothetical protein
VSQVTLAQGVREVDGSVESFSVSGGIYTEASSINNLGQVVGQYTPGTNPQGSASAFLRQQDGSIATFSYPGAVNTQALGINNSGDIVGTYTPSGGGPDAAFIRSANGSFTSVIFPGATATVLSGINNNGEAVGWYIIASGALQGFIDDNGVLTSINYPGSTITYLRAVNDEGQIAGTYAASAGLYGFVATPVPPSPGALLAKLLKDVTGVGPGKRLAHDIELIQTYYAANDVQAACAVLTRFVDEVETQNGRKIGPTLDAQIILDAHALQVAIGCHCGDRRHDHDEERRCDRRDCDEEHKCDERRDCDKQKNCDDRRDGNRSGSHD